MILPKLTARHSRVAVAFLFTVSLFFVGLFLYLSIKRLIFPYELGWMEGSIIEHAARIYMGKQLYVRPTVEFVNWLYQPLYYYVTAAMMHVADISFLAGRLVSFVSTILTSCLILFSAVRLTHKMSWLAIVAPVLYLASYELTGYYYDLASVDSLFTFFVLLSVTAVLISQKLPAILFSALSISLAVFTKQQGFIYVLPFLFWLFFIRGFSAALQFLLIFLLCFFCGTYLLYNANGYWYYFYVYMIPKAKASDFQILRLPFIFSNFLFSFWGIGCGVIIYSCIAGGSKIYQLLKCEFGLVLLILCTAAFQLSLDLGDILSYKNVAMPFAAVFALVFPVSIYRLQMADSKYSSLMPWVVLMQLLAFLYNPRAEQLVDIREMDIKAGDTFVHDVSEMKGNVLIASHHLIPLPPGKQHYANFLAFGDALKVGDSSSKSLGASWKRLLENHFFNFIISDESIFSHGENYQGYIFLRNCNDEEPMIYSTRVGSFTTSPRYIYVPAFR